MLESAWNRGRGVPCDQGSALVPSEGWEPGGCYDAAGLKVPPPFTPLPRSQLGLTTLAAVATEHSATPCRSMGLLRYLCRSAAHLHLIEVLGLLRAGLLQDHLKL